MEVIAWLLTLTLVVLAFSALAQTSSPSVKPGDRAPKTLTISSEVLERSAIKKVKPVAPAGVKASGIVRVRIWIDILDGKVVEAKIVKGHPLLREPALKAARQWEWKPTYIISSSPMRAVGVLSFDFPKN